MREVVSDGLLRSVAGMAVALLECKPDPEQRATIFPLRTTTCGWSVYGSS